MADQEWTDLEAEAEQLRAEQVPDDDPRWTVVQERIEAYKRALRDRES